MLNRKNYTIFQYVIILAHGLLLSMEKYELVKSQILRLEVTPARSVPDAIRNQESGIFNMLWMPDQLWHDDSRTVYGTIKNMCDGYGTNKQSHGNKTR